MNFKIFFRKIKKSLSIIRNYGLYEFIIILLYRFVNRKIRNYLYKSLSIFYSKKIKNFKPNNLNELIEFAFKSGLGLLRPTQIREEIFKLLNILSKNNSISNILEIGTENGGTLFFWSKILKDNGVLISLDLPIEEGGYGYENWRIKLFKNFINETQKLYLLREDSHRKEALEKVKEILNGKKLDFLFIDGDHSYEGVKKDFEMYSPLVKYGGIIAFHDIVFHPNGGSEVDVFWKEIKNKYDYEEIIHNFNQKGCGIGVIYYKNKKNE